MVIVRVFENGMVVLVFAASGVQLSKWDDEQNALYYTYISGGVQINYQDDCTMKQSSFCRTNLPV